MDQDAVATVRAAAEATLRVSGVRFTEDSAMPANCEQDCKLDGHQEGIANLAERRADVISTIPPAIPRAIATAARRLHETHPWVLDEDEVVDIETDNANEQTSHDVFVGGARFLFHPYFTDVCFMSDGDPSSDRLDHRDPTWIIEALAHVDDADRLGIDQLADVPCQRLSFHIDLERHRDELDPLPHVGTLGAPHLVGELWIDDDHMVRRVAREQVDRRRQRHAHRPRVQHARTVTTFQDFGIDASIPIPEVRRSDASTFDVIKSMAAILWRRKRDYQRQHDGAV